MVIRRADKNTEAGVLPSPEVLAAMMQYNEAGAKAGIFLTGTGLQPTSKGARVKFSGGKPAVIDGPLAETRELIAGFSMIEAKSKEEAIEWVKQWASIDAGGEVELEIRQVYTMEDLTREKANED